MKNKQNFRTAVELIFFFISFCIPSFIFSIFSFTSLAVHGVGLPLAATISMLITILYLVFCCKAFIFLIDAND
jgi:4-amino-4-deoxy-L-arabinose transferase-like glycosyltransferase